MSYEEILLDMNLDSSAGVTSPFSFKQEVVDDPVTLQQVVASSEQISCGYSSFSEAMLKDEIRDRERVSAQKTRIFVSSTMEHILCGYRLCGRQNSRMYIDWEHLPSTSGLNTFSQWHDLVQPFLKREKRGINTYSADASSFDSTIPKEVLFVIAYIRYLLSGRDDVTYMQELLNFYRHVVYDPVLSREQPFLPNGKQKSGFINTYADNCMINVFLWAYCFGYQTENFTQDVYMRVGGDDVLMSTRLDPRIAASVMLEKFGVTYTFEEATSVLRGSFLGGHTVWEPSLRRYILQYDLDKLLNSACFARNDNEHFIQRCRGYAPLLVNSPTHYEALNKMFFRVIGRNPPWSYSKLRDLYIKLE